MAINNKGRSGNAQRMAAALGHARDDIQRRADDKLKSFSEEDRKAIRNWSASFQAAGTAQSIAWCASLSSVAGKKAEKLESALASKKQAG